MGTESDFKQVFRYTRRLLIALLVVLVLAYFASGFYIVKPESRGVVKRFGRVIEENVPPGIHYRIPWPIESVQLPRASEVRSITLQFREVLGKDSGLEGGALLTGDENLVMVTLLVQYSIKSPSLYLHTSPDPDRMLGNTAYALMIDTLAHMQVDDTLTSGRQEIQAKVKAAIQEASDKYQLGIRVTSVQIQKMEPPSEVARAFKDVASAREDKHKLVEEAQGDRNRRLPEARAQADRMITEAEAYAKEAVERASGDAQRFTSAWEQYRKAKSVTAHRLYIETMEEVVPRVKMLLSNPKAERRVVPRGF